MHTLSLLAAGGLVNGNTALTAAARPWTAAPHVISLQIDGVAEILTGQRDDVLLAAIGSSWAFRSPIEASADLLPPALIAAIMPR
jgi:hypothetical protein